METNTSTALCLSAKGRQKYLICHSVPRDESHHGQNSLKSLEIDWKVYNAKFPEIRKYQGKFLEIGKFPKNCILVFLIFPSVFQSWFSIHTYIQGHLHTRTFIKSLLTKRIQSAIGKGKTEEKRQEPKKRKPTNLEKDDV